MPSGDCRRRVRAATVTANSPAAEAKEKLAVNERQASGYTPDYNAYSTGAYQTVGTTFADADPLFGPSPDATGGYAYVAQTPQYGHGYTNDHTGHGYAQAQGPAAVPHQGAAPYDTGGYPAGTYDTGTYDTGSYDTGTYPAGGYDTSTYGTGTYDTGTYNAVTYDTGTYESGGYATYDPYATAADATVGAGTGAGTYYDTGTYDAGSLQQAEYQTAYQQPVYQAAPVPQQQDWDSGAYPAYGYGYGYGYGYDASGDTGVYEQLAPQQAPAPEPAPPYEPEPEAELFAAAADELEFAEAAPHDDEPPARHDYAADDTGMVPAARSRRRKPAKRSALLTVGVPSVAVMGVAAVGAAAIAGVGITQSSSKAQADGLDSTTAKNAPTTQFDRQLAGVSADADDFATRASRTQERLDLKDRQTAAKKAQAAAAARKEALRPKFLLPVKERGLSAYFGQSGVNWMALHTGIDFPVQPGTPVSAVTDGTVRTQWNSSYGNMAIVTAPDGTETWYCHLSSTKIRSGTVKAGTVIAYSGNTGNTTGPHLHLEVRPGGGSPIDPLPWLLAHGLDPR